MTPLKFYNCYASTLGFLQGVLAFMEHIIETCKPRLFVHLAIIKVHLHLHRCIYINFCTSTNIFLNIHMFLKLISIYMLSCYSSRVAVENEV